MKHKSIEELNNSEKNEFVELLSDVYEESAWVAEQVHSKRPFSSVQALNDAMRDTVDSASRDTQLELLRAHPDLGEQTEMTDASETEQASAGLTDLSPAQYDTFQQLNNQYREKFGFPFIMAVKNKSPEAIQTTMEDRVEHERDQEFETALSQVHEIAKLRLQELFAP
ncbi:2-oxo-4-hydroxy-4-carboxy-5-ureidoimidazoline decarboxylase [Haloquadratum walsbyi]|uniref:2-oxo-4-hydroxy-4-carboxy-5-ureidoimidazoline decarboxylase n=1 Tax=Haloquadratum walsbyi (strain DSM 16854 / JCM 12705 / C23) TaxID=768065 RepID=G0LH77_HALWC|nr:2-oxo-4-hydroxy-4-carboxy-5-ureidoimidazoline decarboxylase [Haloquadratum walsbyi]CCC40111.1 2-oxo-4-hydroxy-4-carboxy-5-ureidoimidazoline decarboxylase [Haloquadratum walsbyi C23]